MDDTILVIYGCFRGFERMVLAFTALCGVWFREVSLENKCFW